MKHRHTFLTLTALLFATPAHAENASQGGLLSGSLIGSLLQGTPSNGVTILDILIFGLLIYFLLRMLRRRSEPPQRPGDHHEPRSDNDDWQSGNRGGLDNHKPDVYRAAETAWDNLRSEPRHDLGQDRGPSSAQQTRQPANAPNGFDADDFIRGAKLCYARLQEAWTSRNLDDIRHFTTEEVQDEITRQADENPVPSSMELQLVNAKLLNVSQENGHTDATVFFDVQMRVDGRQEHMKEIWHFTRDENSSRPMWLLKGIEHTDT